MKTVASRITFNSHPVSDTLLRLLIQPEPKTNTPLSNITVLLVTESSGRQVCLPHTVHRESTCPSFTRRLGPILYGLSQSLQVQDWERGLRVRSRNFPFHRSLLFEDEDGAAAAAKDAVVLQGGC